MFQAKAHCRTMKIGNMANTSQCIEKFCIPKEFPFSSKSALKWRFLEAVTTYDFLTKEKNPGPSIDPF